MPTGQTIDPNLALTRDDYRQLRERPAQLTPPPIPMVAPDTPVKSSVLDNKEVSLAVGPEIPLRQVLQDLGRQADLNLELDPRISGNIIFNASAQPLRVVLDRLCNMAGLRWSEQDNFIRIELDEPYWQNYPFNYPSLARSSNSEVSISTNVFDVDVATDARNGQNSAGDNNSLARVQSVAEANFWGEIEKSLGQLLQQHQQKKLVTNSAPASTPSSNQTSKDLFTINRQAGMIAVFGSAQQQKAIASYLAELQEKISTQVLIDARIVEVELNEATRSGINWRTLLDNNFNVAGRFGADAAGAPFTNPATATAGVFTAALDNADFAAILNLVREFGTTRILSAPRLTVLNNQVAVLKVARNEVYFTTSAQFPTAVNNNGVTVSGSPVFTSQPRTVPVGLVMTVQPAVDKATQQITLNLRPTISRIVDRIEDPAIGLNAAQARVTAPTQSLIPVLAVREMDSVLQLRSGEVAIMGGLMQDSADSQGRGVPGLDETPVLNLLTRGQQQSGRVAELVIILRATIVASVPPDIVDSKLYQDFTRDPRALIAPARPADSATTQPPAQPNTGQ